ncbi:MAG: IS1634 family transposase [Opitutaceae bacterium]|nr:IS1634 family transposase [Opitutaceae bacterium]
MEKELKETQKSLFGLERSIVLYDVTNTHFEGICAKNPKAKRGRNKQKRNDCRQVAIGMAFDEHGFPLAHEVFEGNMFDTKTLVVLIDRLDMGNQEPALKPVVVLDAGFASKDNINMLKERGYSYIINVTRGSRKKYADLFEKETFEELPGRKASLKVEVKKVADPDDPESRLVLCRSAQRRLKETAMISKAEERFLADIRLLKECIEKGCLKKNDTIERKIGALQKKHPRVQRFYKIQHEKRKFEVIRQDEEIQEAIDLCGNYVLKTDKALDAAQLWGLYMTLLKAESGFRMLKGSLGLRPNYHQLEHRVDGHIFISVLAYHLLRWIERHLELCNDSRSWKTIRRLLSTHSLVSTRLPLEDGRILTIRKPSKPDAEQSLVYKILGIDWKEMCPMSKSELKY